MTQLIARRLREASVYCEIHPYAKAEAAMAAMNPAAIILSGGPESVHEEGSPRAPQGVFEAGVPVLGICYGEMTMCEQLGGKAATPASSAAPRSPSKRPRPCWRAWLPSARRRPSG